MKQLITAVQTIIVLFSISLSYALPLPNLDTATYPLRGESDLERVNGVLRTSYVDWIVSNTDLATGISSSQFRFAFDLNAGTAKGDYATYANDSVWYYYYQIENTSGNFGTSFSLKLEPSTVLTAGYILDVDLDTDLDITHLDSDPGLAGENESGGGSVVNFTGATYDSSPPQPNASLNFTPGLASGSESTVFFVTCFQPPEYFIAELLTGPLGPEGFVPIPLNPVPEPMSMALVASGIAGIYLKKRKRS